jgi:hypothetical protein
VNVFLKLSGMALSTNCSGFVRDEAGRVKCITDSFIEQGDAVTKKCLNQLMNNLSDGA